MTAFVLALPLVRSHRTASHRAASFRPSAPPRCPHLHLRRCPSAVATPPDTPQTPPPNAAASDADVLPGSTDDASTSEPATDAAPDPFETVQNAFTAAVNGAFDTFYRPVRAACPLLQNAWTPTFGNYILHPTGDAAPKSVIHFLGGAFFGAVPHQLYNTLLVRLAARGHVVVATPYDLSFDYLVVADGITQGWEAVEADLATRYGPLPVIGVGHSAGAVFHALTAALFEDAMPKAGNVLISFNCRPARQAIPLYEQLIVPAARAAMAAEQSFSAGLYDRVADWPQTVERLVDESDLTPPALRTEVLPTVRQARRFVDQLLPLFRQMAVQRDDTQGDDTQGDDAKVDVSSDVASDVREFYPPPHEVCDAVERLYGVAETLVVRFENDTLDDSDDLIGVLQRCANSNYSVAELAGSHLTPLAQDGPDLAAASATFGSAFATAPLSAIGSLVGEVAGAFGLRDLAKLEVVIDEWITDGIENGRL